MEDFNRISFIVKNFDKLKGLYFFAVALFYSYQLISPFQPTGMYTEFMLPLMLLTLGLPLLLLGFIPLYYKKSVGTVTAHKKKTNPAKSILIFCIGVIVFIAAMYEIMNKGSGFIFALFFAGILLATPNFKENWARRRYIFPVAAIILLIGLLPFNQFFNFKYDWSASGLKNGLSIMLFYIPVGIFDHFLLLRQMRPLRAESIKNSQASHDPILGDPANLTILAVLSNCQSADFTFLRKMSHLEETEFYRRITGLQQAGLVFIHEVFMGRNKTLRTVSITPLGWQIVNQIYNEVGSNSVTPGALIHA